MATYEAELPRAGTDDRWSARILRALSTAPLQILLVIPILAINIRRFQRET